MLARLGLSVLWVAFAAAASPGARIELEEFRIEPTSLKLGESFTLHAAAQASGVKLGSFVLRTADDVDKSRVIPGFTLYTSNKYYAAEGGDNLLKDNGPRDGNPRDGHFSIKLSTEGWKPGHYGFAFFASCRPSPGPLVVARHDFAVIVEGDRVAIEDLGDVGSNTSRLIRDFTVTPTEIRPSQPVTIRLRLTDAGPGSAEITRPYFHSAEETLKGFEYDADKKVSFRRLSMSGDTLCDELRTEGWPAGVHHLRLNVLNRFGRPADFRNFAIKVAGPKDQFKVSVGPSWHFAPGTHFGRFLRLGDGTILCQEKRSRDGGQTWQPCSGGFGEGGQQLRDGRILGMDYRCLPVEGKEGWYAAKRMSSTDGGQHFVRSEARFHVPEAKAAMGHGPHVGPLFMRSIVERGDGSLVALMAGWFKSDTALCPYGRGRPYSRSYVCESADGGVTWQYLTTICYEQIGSEGYNEGSMRRLANGEILAVLRTGNESDRNCQDNPIMWSTSRDEGRTWSKPQRTGVEGAYPGLAVLSDGVLVMSYGRPGAMVVFSTDNGRTWTDPTCVDATPYSGYTDVVELRPGELLVGFGAQGYLDPATGARGDQLRLAKVGYTRH